MRGSGLRYFFEDFLLDPDRRELRRGTDVVAIAPQVFDLLFYLIGNRERVVSKDDLISAIWQGRAVSDVALTTRLNAARKAIGDSGDDQRLIKTFPRKGVRFVAAVREAPEPTTTTVIIIRPVSRSGLALPRVYAKQDFAKIRWRAGSKARKIDLAELLPSVPLYHPAQAERPLCAPLARRCG